MPSSLPPEVTTFLDQWLGAGWVAAELAGDASVRRYYRVWNSDGRPFVIAYYPEAVRGDSRRFIEAYEAVSGHASIPEVFSRSDWAVAQADVGDQTLFDLLARDRDAAVEHYRAAIDLLVGFQRAPAAAGAVNPPFDTAKFYEELEMTREFYVQRFMGRMDSAAALQKVFREIAEALTSHPYVLCHRDYHGQNLHLINDTLYMIDYQDMRMGPDTYDLASLLRDRGAAEVLGEETEEALIGYYRERAEAGGDVRQRYFESLLQRSIKTAGTFARQALERGRLHYIDFIPAALASVRRCLRELPRYQNLADLFPVSLSASEAGRMKNELEGTARPPG